MIGRVVGPRAAWNGRARGGSFSRPQLETLEDRCLLAAPVIDAISNVSVLVGSSRLLPLTASDADNDTLRYSLSSDSPGVTTELRAGNPSLELAVTYTPRGAAVPTTGKMVFQLFQDIAPNTVATIRRLVEQGFYNNLTFHRVALNNATRRPIPVAIFGGDPRGDGTGGPGFTFDDEFNPAAVFSGDGQLAMANSGKDANGSQFFVTVGEQPLFNFNHTIFGQLVRGFDVRDQIVEVDRASGTERPASAVTISNARILDNKTDAVVLLRATEPGPANITVTATDGTAEGTVTRTFQAFGSVPFEALPNDPPILGPVVNQTTAANTPVTFTLSATDLENDAVEFKAQVLDAPARATVAVNGNQVTVTPVPGFAGTINLLVGAKQVGATRRGSASDPYDTQRIAVSVNAGPSSSLPPIDPSLPPPQRFIVGLYRDLLGRDPDPTGMSIFLGHLGRGVPTWRAVQFVQVSPEYRTKVVNDLYQSLLGRPADPNGLNEYVTLLGRGGSPDRVRAAIFCSPEYLQRMAGGTNAGFLRSVYRDVLGREIDPVGEQNHARLLDRGLSRFELAAALLASPERRRGQVEALYQTHLDRTSGPSERAEAVYQLTRGVREELLVAGMLSSPEAMAKR